MTTRISKSSTVWSCQKWSRRKLSDQNIVHKLHTKRRLSTATTKYDMYLINLGHVEKFGSSSDRKKILSLSSCPLDRKAHKIWGSTLGIIRDLRFTSMELVHYPDPNGRQMYVLSKCCESKRWTIQDRTDPFHVLVYKDNTITSPKSGRNHKRVLVRLVFAASTITRNIWRRKCKAEPRFDSCSWLRFSICGTSRYDDHSCSFVHTHRLGGF